MLNNASYRLRGVIVWSIAVSIVLLPSMITSAQDLPQNQQRERIAVTRRVFVHSTALLVRAAVVEDKLLKRSEFKQMGFVITRDPREADLLLELRHDVLTMYVFTVTDVKSMTVIAGGKLSSLGGTVGDKVAKRFIKEMGNLKQTRSLECGDWLPLDLFLNRLRGHSDRFSKRLNFLPAALGHVRLATTAAVDQFAGFPHHRVHVGSHIS